MAFHRKEKENPSSRYSRIEEPWLDEEKGGAAPQMPGEVPGDGFGVRDSYSRQASYGRPEGYYPPDPYQGADRYQDNGMYGPGGPYEGGTPYGADGRSDGYAGDPNDGRYGSYPDDGRYGSAPGGGYGGYPDEGGYAQGPGNDPYGGYPDNGRYGSAPGDGGYGGNPDAGRYGGPGRSGGYGGPGREPGYNQTGTGGYDGTPAVPTSGSRSAVRKKSKTGFFVKLILLLIAAAVLIAIWRFSRLRHVSLTDIVTNAGVTGHTGYREFVIYGVDSREGNLTKEAHSDTIILCSMNESTKEIRLVSVYRDTYLDNTNGEYRKATECYYFGGPSRSVNMLNKNLDLDLHDYVTVDFNAVVKAVDLIGGVDVEVTEEELPYINGYQTENAQVTGAQITPVESAGYQHLNGIQALAYCRIRYTAGSDYRRTERQRTVLSQIFAQAKSQGPVKLAQLVDAMLPYIATSFSSADLLSLATSFTQGTLMDSVGFPFELQAANIAAGDCVVPVNLAQNVSELHAYLYQQNGYTPSETVQAISNEIANTTGIY